LAFPPGKNPGVPICKAESKTRPTTQAGHPGRLPVPLPAGLGPAALLRARGPADVGVGGHWQPRGVVHAVGLALPVLLAHVLLVHGLYRILDLKTPRKSDFVRGADSTGGGGNLGMSWSFVRHESVPLRSL